MDESDAELPSPAPLLAASGPATPLRRDQTGPADASMPPLASPMRDRADGPDPAAPTAGTLSARAGQTDQSRPEHDTGPALLQLEAAAADTLGKAPVGADTETADGDPAQDLLPPGKTGALGPVWDELAGRAAHYATTARGAGTRRTYKSAWTHFSAWCRDLGREPLCGDPDLTAMCTSWGAPTAGSPSPRSG
jgi:hypothetical protein